MEYYANRLANFISHLNFEELPTNVIEKAKSCILDWIGVTLLGSSATEGKTVVELVRNLGGKEESTVVGFGDRTNCINASLANGTMAHSFDYDDSVMDCALHVGCVTIPAALSVAEREKATGRDLITSVVAGYDAMVRVGLAVNYMPKIPLRKRGFHPTGACGPFGAAAAAGKILGLDADGLADALGIAAECSSGLSEYHTHGAMTKRLHAGKAAYDGVLSAILAQRGFSGPHSIFEGVYGFFKAYSDECDPRPLIEGYREVFYITKSSLKYYSACIWTHPAIDALLGLVDEYGVQPEDVAEISVIIPSPARVVTGSRKYNPGSFIEAQMSLPYCLSIALIDGEVSPKQFSEEKIKNPKVLGLSQKIKVTIDPEMDEVLKRNKIPVVVEVKTKNNKRYSNSVDYPRGFYLNPLTPKELQQKFRNLAATVLSNEKTERTIELVDALEKLDNVAELLHFIT